MVDVLVRQKRVCADGMIPVYPSEMSAPILARSGGFTRDSIPLERLGDDQDMAGSILYLASRAGGYCNGSVIVTDGGRLGVFPSSF